MYWYSFFGSSLCWKLETHKLRHNLLLVERFIKEVELVQLEKNACYVYTIFLKSALDKRTGTLYVECPSIHVTYDTNTRKPISCRWHRKNHRCFSKRMMDSWPWDLDIWSAFIRMILTWLQSEYPCQHKESYSRISSANVRLMGP